MVINALEIVKDIEDHELKGLEKLCFLYRDFEANFHYDPNKGGSFFNRVRQIRSNNSSFQELLKRIDSFYVDLGINPAISFNIATTPRDLEKKFSEEYKKDIIHVFVYNKDFLNENGSLDKNIDISITQDTDEFGKVFIEVFKNPEEDIETLKKKIQYNFNFQENLHLVGRYGGQLVGSVGSICFNGVYVIYGLAVREEFRGNGFGKAIAKVAIKELLKNKPKLIYFKSRNQFIIDSAACFGFEKAYEQIYFQRIK